MAKYSLTKKQVKNLKEGTEVSVKFKTKNQMASQHVVTLKNGNKNLCFYDLENEEDLDELLKYNDIFLSPFKTIKNDLSFEEALGYLFLNPDKKILCLDLFYNFLRTNALDISYLSFDKKNNLVWTGGMNSEEGEPCILDSYYNPNIIDEFEFNAFRDGTWAVVEQNKKVEKKYVEKHNKDLTFVN